MNIITDTLNDNWKSIHNFLYPIINKHVIYMQNISLKKKKSIK